MAIKNTCIIVLIIVAGLASLPQVVHASPSSHSDEQPSLDGVVRCIGIGYQYHCIEDPSFDGFGTCIAYRAKWCASQSLTTSKEEDVIVLVVVCFCQSDSPSITDSAGLNYTLRVSYSASSPWEATMEEYYATAESPLTADNITVADSIHSFYGPIQVFAIHPGETKTTFDRNQSLPITLTCPSSQTPGLFVFQDCSASAGRLAHDFVIAITAILDAGPCRTSSGFSELVFDGSSLDIDYRIVRQSESNVAFTCASTDSIAMVFDAISLHPGHDGD